MKQALTILAFLIASISQAQQPARKHLVPPPIHVTKGVVASPYNANHLKYPRGLAPTPRNKLILAPRFRPTGIRTPAQVLMLPKQLSMWGNDQYGDCVSASEAARKAAYSVYCGLPETFIPEANVISWARRYGYLNGAMLDEVMDQAARNGMVASDGKTYLDGPYTSVNYGDESELQAALTVGPINLGLDANALPSGAGNDMGWYAFGGRPGEFNNEDHCTALFGFGPTALLFQQVSQTYGVNVTPPANAPASGYLFFTWSTIGIVDHAWIMSTVGEAWVQHPQTVGQMPQPGPTPVPPGPTPTPTGATITISADMKAGTYQLGGTILRPDMTLKELIDMMPKAGQAIPIKVEAKMDPPAPKDESLERRLRLMEEAIMKTQDAVIKIQEIMTGKEYHPEKKQSNAFPNKMNPQREIFVSSREMQVEFPVPRPLLLHKEKP